MRRAFATSIEPKIIYSCSIASQRTTTPSGRPKHSSLEREKLLRQGIESAVEDLDLSTMLSKVVENACKLLGAEDGSVGLVAHEPTRMIVTAVHNLPDSELGSEWLPGAGLAGLILTSGRAIVINRYGDIDPQKRAELAENAVVGVPIVRRKRLIGFFGIGAKSPRRFTQSDIRVLTQFANACGVAIENARLFESTQLTLKHTQLLYSTTSILSQAANLDDVIVSYLRQIAVSMNVNCMVVLYEQSQDGQIEWNVARGQCSPDGHVTSLDQRTPHVRDNLDDVLESGGMVLFSDIDRDPRAPKNLRDMQRADGRPSLALIPLVSGGKRIGLVTLSRPVVHEWTDEEIQPFAVTAAHLAAAIDIRQEQDRNAEQRSNLALVEERKRLARDLHDSVTQSLFAMQLLSQAIVGETTEAGSAKAVQLAELCRNSLKEMRSLLGELRPLDGLGTTGRQTTEDLAARLRRHVRELGMRQTLDLDFDRFRGSTVEVEHTLFRIAQEALTNCHKHSRATAIGLELSSNLSEHRLVIKDNGVGMPTAPTDDKTKYGLVGIHERAHDHGGTVVIESSPGNGVTITVDIPT